jgi:hypothetical protein
MRPNIGSDMIVKVCKRLHKMPLDGVSVLFNPPALLQSNKISTMQFDFETTRGGAVSNLEVETDHPIDEGNCVNKNTCLNAIIDEIGHKICRQTMTEVVIKRHLVAEL